MSYGPYTALASLCLAERLHSQSTLHFPSFTSMVGTLIIVSYQKPARESFGSTRLLPFSPGGLSPSYALAYKPQHCISTFREGDDEYCGNTQP
jgi:hypothetical protein